MIDSIFILLKKDFDFSDFARVMSAAALWPHLSRRVCRLSTFTLCVLLHDSVSQQSVRCLSLVALRNALETALAFDVGRR